jgi:hypothetical protein
MLDVAIGVFLFLSGFWLRGQLVELKWKPRKQPDKIAEKVETKSRQKKIDKTNPSTPLNR